MKVVRDFKGQFVFSGNCEGLLGDLAEGFWNTRNYELRMKLYNDGAYSGSSWNFDLLKVYFMGDYQQLNEYFNERVVTCSESGKEGVWLSSGQTKTVQ